MTGPSNANSVGWKWLAGVLLALVLGVASWVTASVVQHDTSIAINAERMYTKDRAMENQEVMNQRLWDIQQRLAAIENLLQQEKEKK